MPPSKYVLTLAPHSRMVMDMSSSNSDWTWQAQDTYEPAPGEMNNVEEFGVQSRGAYMQKYGLSVV
jgi:hypothetical protein